MNLEEKYVDTLRELDEYVDDIKDISKTLRELTKKVDDNEIIRTLNENRNVLFDIAQQIRDIKYFHEFYFKEDSGVRHITRERDTYMLLYQIMKWDTIDVRDLLVWLNNLRELCDAIGLRPEDLVNFRRLDTQPIPEDIASYPVLVKDNNNLYIFIDANNYVTVNSQFLASTNGIEKLQITDGSYLTRTDMDTIINAMSDITNNAGLDLMDKFAAMSNSNDYAAVLAQSWHQT